jgi:hypothetical protein
MTSTKVQMASFEANTQIQHHNSARALAEFLDNLSIQDAQAGKAKRVSWLFWEVPFMLFESLDSGRPHIGEAPIPERSSDEKRERSFTQSTRPLTLLGVQH